MQNYISKMNRKPDAYLFLCLICLLLGSCSEHQNVAFAPIFDGKTFAGWEGPKDFFRIEAGAMVAGSLNTPIPLNQFLCTEKSYEDFDLTMQVKFTSRENNGGIQFRSQRIPNHHEVAGYQADVGSTSAGFVWGGLYDESRRNKFLKQPDPEVLEKALKPDAWNEYRIRCKGPKVQFWLNGIRVLEYQEADPEISRSGVICVQIHSGVSAEAWYKDIRIKEI